MYRGGPIAEVAGGRAVVQNVAFEEGGPRRRGRETSRPEIHIEVPYSDPFNFIDPSSPTLNILPTAYIHT